VVFVGRRLIERASPINTWNLRSSSVKPRMRFAPQAKSEATAKALEHFICQGTLYPEICALRDPA
jgi:hypothetical protein